MAPARRKRVKLIARNAPALKPRVILKEGDWIDVLDGDGVWNVARVLRVPSPDEVEVTYDGWGEEYDEIVQIDSNRVAPYHTFTWAVKCWVKYLNWPLWPSLITIRTPGTKEGIRNLAAERRVFVDFFDGPNFAKRDRCWQPRRLVRTFEDNFDKKRTGSTGVDFEQALKLVLQSVASTKMPKFALGALPLEYKSSPTESVEAARRKMGDEEWYQRFAHNQMHHKQNHVYETLGYEEIDASSDDSASSTSKKTGDDVEKEESMEISNTKDEEDHELRDDTVSPRLTDSRGNIEENVEIPNAMDEEDDGLSDDPAPPAMKESPGDIEEEEKLELPDAKDSRVVIVSDEKVYPVFQDSSTKDDDKDEESQPCQRVRGVQPDSEEAPDTSKTGIPMRTVISVPRKFDVVPPPLPRQEPVWFKSTMAPPPRLNLSASSVRTGAALAAPSTAVFSSSKGFSLESWFKRKLMADFLNGDG